MQQRPHSQGKVASQYVRRRPVSTKWFGLHESMRSSQFTTWQLTVYFFLTVSCHNIHVYTSLFHAPPGDPDSLYDIVAIVDTLIHGDHTVTCATVKETSEFHCNPINASGIDSSYRQQPTAPFCYLVSVTFKTKQYPIKDIDKAS